MGDDTVSPGWWNYTPWAPRQDPKRTNSNTEGLALLNRVLFGRPKPTAGATSSPRYSGYTDSTMPPTSRAGDADVLVRGPNYVYSLFAPKGFKIPKIKKPPKRVRTRDTGVGTPNQPLAINWGSGWELIEGLGTSAELGRRLGVAWLSRAVVRSPSPSAAGRTNRTGAKSTRRPETASAPRATRTGEQKVVSVPGILQTQVLVGQAARPKPFARVLTDPNSTWQPAPTRTTTRSATKDPGNLPTATAPKTTTGFTKPAWWDAAEKYVNLLAEIKQEGRVKSRDAKKEAKPAKDVATLLGLTGPGAASLTSTNTDPLALAQPGASTPTGTSTKVCECPPKKPRKKSCRNPVISRLTKGGVRTVKTRIVCQSSSRK